MKAKVLALKNRLLGSGGTTSGVLGGIGSVHNVCHSLCMTIVSFLAALGITTSILPLMFLQTYQVYFWIAALVFTALSFYFYVQQNKKLTRDRNFLFINSGLLIFGLPFSQLADYMDFFRFIGISVVLAGVFLFFLAKRFQYVQYSDSSSVQTSANDSLVAIPAMSTVQFPKLTLSSVLFVIVVSGFLINQYLMYRMGAFDTMNNPIVSTAASAMKSLSTMKLTPFDVVLAKEHMDKNNDGICDTCGMPMQQCIDSGQLDCNMGNNPNAIGILGSQHVHADFKVYVDGQPIDFAKPEYYMKSSFMHVDSNPNSTEDASGVVHMHATKVPLNIFFRSLGMKLEKDSFTTADGQIYKTGNSKSLKFYLNGHKVDELGEYVFQPFDKILISYGPDNDPAIQKQIDSVTTFAKDHQK